MKTDVIEISPTGEGMAEALRQTEKAAAFQNLNPKQGLRLRLLAEEMMGMLRTSSARDRPATGWRRRRTGSRCTSPWGPE